MPELTLHSIILFAAFVLPGTISMYIFGLVVPQADHDLKNKIVEAVSFSLVNFVVLFPLINRLGDTSWILSNIWVAWGLVIVCFLVAPAIWPFVVAKVIRWLEQGGIIMVQAHTSLDEFFGKAKDGCWLIVELNDSSLVGGRFGSNSFASAYPDSGHLYIEELWEVGTNGAFGGRVDGAPGILLRPTDYRHVRVFLE